MLPQMARPMIAHAATTVPWLPATAVATGQFLGLEHRRQYRVLHRAEQGRLHAGAEQRDQQHRQALGQEAGGGQRHDHDLHGGGDHDQPRFFQLVGDLPGQCREQEVRQDEDGWRQRGVQPQFFLRHGHEQQHADDRLPVDVVIERTERLDHEERQETALAQQGELVVTGHGASLTGAA
ncbi:hypothetical protein G6F65_019180 [Rhizopus arrhizus]|nr:hypothetical protein G6F65_019180 [Rhizopus arrhizus]